MEAIRDGTSSKFVSLWVVESACVTQFISNDLG